MIEGGLDLSRLRVAIVHPFLINRGGGEKVVEALAAMFPRAELFTLMVDRRTLSPILQDRAIHTTFLDRGAAAWRYYQHLSPLYDTACSRHDLPGFDLVISSGGPAAKTAARQTSRFWRWKVRRYVSQLARTEDRLASTWPLTLVCSRHDAQLLRERGHEASELPNAVRFGDVLVEPEQARLQILFVGTLSYRPNADGIIWFVENVWPRLVEELEGMVDLKIVGFDPPQDVVALGLVDGIDVVGPVDDLAPLYAASHVVVVPIFSGSGTRIKILEAFAFSRAIVTTPIGCEAWTLPPAIMR